MQTFWPVLPSPVTPDCRRDSGRRLVGLSAGKARNCPHTTTAPHATPATHGRHQLLTAGPFCELPRLGAFCPAEGGCPGPGHLHRHGEWGALPTSGFGRARGCRPRSVQAGPTVRCFSTSVPSIGVSATLGEKMRVRDRVVKGSLPVKADSAENHHAQRQHFSLLCHSFPSSHR